MADEPATSQEIRDQLSADVLNGVASFSDGTNSVQMLDPEKRLAIAKELAAAEAVATQNTNFGLRTVALKGGGAWQ